MPKARNFKCLYSGYTIAVALLLSVNISSYGQKVDPDRDVMSKNPKAEKVINKILLAISFLTYTDRKKDRILDSPEEFERFRGKKLDSINFRILKPYGVSIQHPDTVVTKKLSRFANRIHISSRPSVLKNEMLIKSGDTIDPQLIADMQRNIWNKNIYKDLRITLHSHERDTNSADMEVMAQDLMTWNLVDDIGIKRAAIGIELKNFLGYSQFWNNYVALNYRRDKLWSFYGGYEFRNIASSQFSFKLNYNYDPLMKGFETFLGRNFYSNKTNWAGYVFSNYYKQTARETNFLTTSIPTNVLYNAQAVWLAGAFPLKLSKFKSDPNQAYRLILSAKFNRIQYQQRPFMRADDNSIAFINSRTFMGAIGIARWDYYTDQYANDLVKTEYFTKGFNLAFLAGAANEEDAGLRYYTAFVATYAYKVKQVGYFALRAKWGTYIKHEKPENQVLNSNLVFISNSINLGKKIFMRQHIRVNYNHGWNFADGQDLFLNDGNGGVRGIFLNLLRGNQTFSVTIEPNFYGKFKVFGFTGCLFAFADIAYANGDNLYSRNRGVIHGYGAGFRLRQLKIGVNYIDITFAYYPDLLNYKNWTVLGNLSNPRKIGNYAGTLFDSRTMAFQNAPGGDADYIFEER